MEFGWKAGDEEVVAANYARTLIGERDQARMERDAAQVLAQSLSNRMELTIEALGKERLSNVAGVVPLHRAVAELRHERDSLLSWKTDHERILAVSNQFFREGRATVAHLLDDPDTGQEGICRNLLRIADERNKLREACDKEFASVQELSGQVEQLKARSQADFEARENEFRTMGLALQEMREERDALRRACEMEFSIVQRFDNENAELKRRIANLAEDKKRLDWIQEESPRSIYHDLGGFAVVDSQRQRHDARLVRDAIDAAMGKPKPKQKIADRLPPMPDKISPDTKWLWMMQYCRLNDMSPASETVWWQVENRWTELTQSTNTNDAQAQ